MEGKRVYRIVANGSNEVFNEECLEEEALAKLYKFIAERKYEWLELRLGQANEEDEVIDSVSLTAFNGHQKRKSR